MVGFVRSSGGQWQSNTNRIMNPQVSVPKKALTNFCLEHGIRRLAIYGSALRDDFGPDSGYRSARREFGPDRIPGLLGVASMELSLSELFAGRKVDLRTAEDLSPYFRQKVLDKAEVQICAGMTKSRLRHMLEAASLIFHPQPLFDSRIYPYSSFHRVTGNEGAVSVPYGTEGRVLSAVHGHSGAGLRQRRAGPHCSASGSLSSSCMTRWRFTRG